MNDSKYFDENGVLTDAGAMMVAGGLRVLAGASYRMAEVKGFHSLGRTKSEELMLIASEVFEAFEAERNGEPELWYRDVDSEGNVVQSTEFMEGDRMRKPEGRVAELADTIIRLGDTVGMYPDTIEQFIDAVIQKNRYNGTRGHRHGGKSL